MHRTAATGDHGDERSSYERILDATVSVLAREGIAGVSMRAVAREADVAVGLANYHFDNKVELISAALRRIGEVDLEFVTPNGKGDAAEQLRRKLRQALDSSYLTPTYLSLRLQLWSLAGVDPTFAEINEATQRRYLAKLGELVAAARPDLDHHEVARRASDILVEQNGVWLTATFISDAGTIERALARCETLAFG